MQPQAVNPVQDAEDEDSYAGVDFKEAMATARTMQATSAGSARELMFQVLMALEGLPVLLVRLAQLMVLMVSPLQERREHPASLPRIPNPPGRRLRAESSISSTRSAPRKQP